MPLGERYNKNGKLSLKIYGEVMSDDNNKHDNYFIMPESDGIRNDVPLEGNTRGSKAQEPEMSDLTPKSFSSRLNEAVSGNGSSNIMETHGMTIKAQLVATLSMLTLIILVIGYISFTSIVEINLLSVSIGERQSALAKITEEVKVSVFQAREAEKDFLLLEEQEALDRSIRFVSKMRSQLERANAIGLLIEESSGVLLTSNYVAMADAIDTYETEFAEQVKNVKAARDSIAADLGSANISKAGLASRADKMRRDVKGIVDDFWIKVKKSTQNASDIANNVAKDAALIISTGKEDAEKLLLAQSSAAIEKLESEAQRIIDDTQKQSVIDSSNSTVAAAAAAVKNEAILAQQLLAESSIVAANLVADTALVAATKVLDVTVAENAQVLDLVILGTVLADLDRTLLNVQVSVARYLQLNSTKFSDEAIAGVATALGLVDTVRRTQQDEKMNLQMAEVRQLLLEYQREFRSSVTLANTVAAKVLRSGADIKAQKLQLKATGVNLILIATQLSAESWGNIAKQSAQLQLTGGKAQTLVLTLVIIGALLGMYVLWAVPRPIFAAINQLLVGAQRVAAGDLTQVVSVSSRDELGQLAATFEHMRSNLLSLVNRIQEASLKISSTVNQIQDASTQQSAAASEQANALTEFAVTMREITQTTERLAGSANDVAGNSEQIAQRVGEASGRSSQMMVSMNAIGDSTRQTSDRIKALNDQMDSISDAVASISSVADQTTLLSLNAAIEANKAGEMGKGFSVVATEIRRLSDRSIDSATGIAGVVRDIKRATESSVVSMDKSSEEILVGMHLVQESSTTMQEVNQSMGQVGSLTRDIAKGVIAQAETSINTQDSITEMLASSTVSAQAAGLTLSSSYELSAMATQLSDAVSVFKT
jgi:methyl-accepting chemotaxis protein